MKHSIAALSIAVALALTGCSDASPSGDGTSSAPSTSATPSAAAPAGSDVAGPSASAPSPQDVLAALTVDVTKTKVFTFDDGLKVTFDGATLATPEQIGSDPVAGSDAVILAFTYTNGSPAAIPLQAVPLSVLYGTDMYAADSPTLFQGDPTKTELPKQIVPGSTVKVVNTYWIPTGEPITAQVDVSGSVDMARPMPTFEGISTKS